MKMGYSITVTQAQKKIIFIALVMVLSFSLFLLLVYLPTKSRAERLRSELSDLEAQIKAAESYTLGARSPEEGVKLLKERYRYLDSKLPLNYAQALAMIPELARRLNIEVLSSNNTAPAQFIDKAGLRMEIEGRSCSLISVSMDLKCSYKDLVRYLDALKKVVPVFITVERLSVQRENQLSARLNVKLSLNIYFLT